MLLMCCLCVAYVLLMDMIWQVKASQVRKEPYVIVFVGVNGVGKSTSLSKVCFFGFWLTK